jgi:hypothetical protein
MIERMNMALQVIDRLLAHRWLRPACSCRRIDRRAPRFSAGTIPAYPANRILFKGVSVMRVRASEAGRQG